MYKEVKMTIVKQIEKYEILVRYKDGEYSGAHTKDLGS